MPRPVLCPRTVAASLAVVLTAAWPMTAGAAPASASPSIDAASCTPDGDKITVTGRLGIGHITPPDDPSHHTQNYLFIAFDPTLCVVEPGASTGERVARAEFLTERPPLKSMMGVENTYTGSIERGSEATNERYSFVAY